MARIAGVDIPGNKRGEIALTYIYGIGRSSAGSILNKAGINLDRKPNEWSEEEANAIRAIISAEFKVEGVLKSEVQMSMTDGHWLLPWPPPQEGSPSPWSENQKQLQNP